MPARDEISVKTSRTSGADPAFEKQVRKRFIEKRKLLEKQMVRIALGKPALGESAERIQLHQVNRFVGTMYGRGEIRQEASFGEINDFLAIDYFKLGYLASRAVGRIVHGPIQGSGFLVAPGLLMTNEHVIANDAAARGATVFFDTVSQFGQQFVTFQSKLDPDRFLYVSRELDFTVVALKEDPAIAIHLERLGWHPMLGSQGKILLGHPITIIQYPQGLDKTVVIHNSHLLELDARTGPDRDPYFWYRSDTQGGSSGSPVFDREWRVIGVHHAAIHLNEDRIGRSRGESSPNAGAGVATAGDAATGGGGAGEDGPAYVANEGVRTSVIVDDIEDAYDKGRFDTPEMARVAEILLNRWQESVGNNAGLSAASLGNLADIATAVLPDSQTHVMPELSGVRPEAGRSDAGRSDAGRGAAGRSDAGRGAAGTAEGRQGAPGPRRDEPSISITITIDGRRL